MIVYDQISWRELIFAIYLAYLEANLNDSFLGDLGIDFVNPSVNTVLPILIFEKNQTQLLLLQKRTSSKLEMKSQKNIALRTIGMIDFQFKYLGFPSIQNISHLKMVLPIVFLLTF